MLEDMPSEIISEIFSILAIRDCKNTVNAFNLCAYDIVYKYISNRTKEDVESKAVDMWNRQQRAHSKFNKELQSRLSITNYLNKTLPDSHNLLKCMLINNVLISGSRAMEFFMPGCIDENSDWDFYIGNNATKIEAFTKYMESKGVVWNPETETSEDLSASGYPDAGNISITQGTMTYRKKENRIQLIVYRSGGNLLDIIRKFNASIAQCFISPYMACHMYYYDLHSRQSTVWTTDYTQMSEGKKYIAKWIHKYKKRGFKFYRISMHSMLYPDQKKRVIKRTIADPNTEIITTNLQEYSGIRYQHMKLAMHELYNYSWLEYSDRLESNDFPSDYKIDQYYKTLSTVYNTLKGVHIGELDVLDANNEIKDIIHKTFTTNISEIEDIEGPNLLAEEAYESDSESEDYI